MKTLKWFKNFALLVIFAFGLTFIACDNSNGETNPYDLFKGTWYSDSDIDRMIFNGQNWTVEELGGSNWTNLVKGTFEINEGTGKIIFYRTHNWNNDSWIEAPATSQTGDFSISGNILTIVNCGAGWDAVWTK